MGVLRCLVVLKRSCQYLEVADNHPPGMGKKRPGKNAPAEVEENENDNATQTLTQTKSAKSKKLNKLELLKQTLDDVDGDDEEVIPTSTDDEKVPKEKGKRRRANRNKPAKQEKTVIEKVRDMDINSDDDDNDDDDEENDDVIEQCY